MIICVAFYSPIQHSHLCTFCPLVTILLVIVLSNPSSERTALQETEQLVLTLRKRVLVTGWTCS